MPWYQIVAVILTSLVAAIAIGRTLYHAFQHAVANVMSHQIQDINRSLDELDRMNAQRFAQLDNMLGAIQAQFEPNSGASHRDRLEALHTKIETLTELLGRKDD